MLPSGVICGFTLSARLALRKDTEVAPEEVACWYGISVPCSISASTWSAVSTRGLAMILPLPSASSAESSRRSEEHTSELQSQSNLVCRLLLEKKKKKKKNIKPEKKKKKKKKKQTKKNKN